MEAVGGECVVSVAYVERVARGVDAVPKSPRAGSLLLCVCQQHLSHT